MVDACIIGVGGIVGCAIARELAERGVSVAGIEKHDTACQETSGLNSRVIHSGLHEVPGTLKAELAREGSRLMIRYAEERGLKDTVKANPGQFTTIRAKFDLPESVTAPQDYVYHCHIVEHEDNDMMRSFTVTT